MSSTWQHNPVWIHGDIAVGNPLVKNDRLAAIIDFGQLAVGDPACDLSFYWTFFSEHDRAIFRSTLMLDDDTWRRARGWVLWKTLCVPVAGTDCQKIITAIIEYE